MLARCGTEQADYDGLTAAGLVAVRREDLSAISWGVLTQFVTLTEAGRREYRKARVGRYF
jgi:hypothetical protein